MTSDLCPSDLKNGEAKYGFQPLMINNFLITVTIGDGESCGLSGGGGAQQHTLGTAHCLRPFPLIMSPSSLSIALGVKA